MDDKDDFELQKFVVIASFAVMATWLLSAHPEMVKIIALWGGRALVGLLAIGLLLAALFLFAYLTEE